MGAVTYSNDVKSMLLGVPEELFPAYGAVSEPVARAMAEGVRKKAGASGTWDYGPRPGPAAERRKSRSAWSIWH